MNNDERRQSRTADRGSYLSTSQHNLSRDEDQEHDFGLDHAIDETREQLKNDFSNDG